MGKLFCLIGRSCTGKDTIITKVLDSIEDRYNIKRLVYYTTREKRQGEEEGYTYYFTTDEEFLKYKEKGLVAESREYPAKFGNVTYYTLIEQLDNIEKDDINYIATTTLIQFNSYRHHLGKDNVIPIYINSSYKDILSRYIKRLNDEETNGKIVKDIQYIEICRRIVSEEEEYNSSNLHKYGICATPSGENIFLNSNDTDMDELAASVSEYIISHINN